MMNKDQNFSERLHSLIPGGAHTYSRGDDQFPKFAPPILKRGQGCYVYDPDDKAYLDYGMGLRSVNIGYGNREIADRVFQEALNGNNLTRASLTELHAAEALVGLIDSVDMVKFAKHGSTVTTAAVKLARAYTKRKIVAVPSEHPFFSFDDWFIGSTVMSSGVPAEISNLTARFNYNNIESLEMLFSKYPDQIAAVILEPATSEAPIGNIKDNFLHQVQRLCKENGALFILDEMITGFRWHLKGAQYYYGLSPDLTTFGKAMANGFAVAALGGKRHIMEIGGIIKEGQERVFLTSTTHGAEMGSLGAFLKTIEIIERDKVIEHIWQYGASLIKGLNSISADLGIEEYFYLSGYECSPVYYTKDSTGQLSLEFRTLFAQEMMRRGIIMPYIALSGSHNAESLALTLEAAESSLKIYKEALVKGLKPYLISKVIKPVFRQFN